MMVPTHLVLMFSCGSFFFAVFIAAYSLAAAPIAPGSRLGIRGLKRTRALDSNPLFAKIDPLLRWLAARVSPLVKGGFRAQLERQLVAAGDFWGLSPEDYMGLNILACSLSFLVVGVVEVLFHKPFLLVLLIGPFGAALPYFHLSGEAQRRLRRIQNALPYAIDLMSLALSAGLDFPGALRQVVDKTSDPGDPLAEEFSYVLQELQIGKTRRQALTEFRSRVHGESVREFVNAVIQAEERGNPLADVLQIQARSSRQRRSVRAEEQAAKAGLKILVPCLLVFAAVILLIVSPLFFKIQPLLAN
jgi:tight adherence protein C